jgi:hypothetical protein
MTTTEFLPFISLLSDFTAKLLAQYPLI